MKIGRVAIIAVALLLAAACSSATTTQESFSDPAANPILSLPLVAEDGTTTSLGDFSSKPIVANFFASWCPPCRAEIPDFESSYTDHNGAVHFVGVNRDNDQTAWQSFIATLDISYPTVYDDGALFDAVGGVGMPTTLFITTDGAIAYSQTGALTRERLDELISEHLAS